MPTLKTPPRLTSTTQTQTAVLRTLQLTTLIRIPATIHGNEGGRRPLEQLVHVVRVEVVVAVGEAGGVLLPRHTQTLEPLQPLLQCPPCRRHHPQDPIRSPSILLWILRPTERAGTSQSLPATSYRSPSISMRCCLMGSGPTPVVSFCKTPR